MNEITQENQLLRIVCSVFDAYSAVLFLPNDAEDGWRLAASFSLGDKILPTVSVSNGKGLIGWIATNHEPMRLNNMKPGQNALDYYADEEEAQHIKAFMGVPIDGGGVLCVDSKRQYSFSEKECKILQLFAEMVSCCRTEQHQDWDTGSISSYFSELSTIQALRHRTRSWSAYIQKYLEILAAATAFDYCAFLGMDDAEHFSVEGESRQWLMTEGLPVSLPMGGTLAGCVFRTEEPLIQEQLGEQSMLGRFQDVHFRTVMCMPVRVSRSTRAVLCLGNQESKKIDEPLRTFVLQCVDILSAYLENLYLKNRLRSLLPPVSAQPLDNEE